MSTDVRVLTGIWINWSHGAIRGATLTLERHHGAILAAFLAIYVSFAGGAFWRLLSFVLHQLGIPEPSLGRDILRRHRQVILRNSGTSAFSAAQSFAALAVEQRGKATMSILHCLPFVFLALATALAFTAAGIFTSTITQVPGNATIILGPSCGGYELASASTSAALSQLLQKVLADVYEAANYVRQCYQPNSSSLACGTYVRPSLPFTIDGNATCPFSPRLCVPGNESAFSMDTGFLNSHHDFGVNAPAKNRILYRRLTTCSPIFAKDFVSYINNSEIIEINAGPNGFASNYTFRFATHATVDGIGYMLR